MNSSFFSGIGACCFFSYLLQFFWFFLIPCLVYRLAPSHFENNTAVAYFLSSFIIEILVYFCNKIFDFRCFDRRLHFSCKTFIFSGKNEPALGYFMLMRFVLAETLLRNVFFHSLFVEWSTFPLNLDLECEKKNIIRKQVHIFVLCLENIIIRIEWNQIIPSNNFNIKIMKTT